MLLLQSNYGFSQSYLSNKGKFHFAQGSMGVDFQYVGANGSSSFITDNVATPFQVGGYYIPRIVIGGLHFWGHADIAFNFPIGAIGKKEAGKYSFSDFDIMTFKYYPWAIQKNKIRPFVGTSFNINTFQQRGTGTYKNYYSGNDFKLGFPINAGLSYQKGSFLFNLDAKFNLNTNRTIYASRTQTTTLNLPTYGVSFGVRKLFESTAPKFEKRFEDGTMAKEYEQIKHKLNAFSFGIGLSSSFYTNISDYNKAERKFVSANQGAVFIPEFGIGYYLDKPDLHFNLAYRKFNAYAGGYGIGQLYARQSLTLEAFKFLFDYKGFLPFVGVGVGKDNLRFLEQDLGKTTVDVSASKVSTSFIFGWDIRYHRNYWLMLRTNMRYYPSLSINSPVGKIKFNQLELNFIQAVVYPQRLKDKLKRNK